MSQDSLDVLADVLQAYLCKVGKTMAYLVESSGRPSSHTNALDAMQAIHMTTAPAANQVHSKTETAATRSQRVAPWHDLAVFCFGPKWEGGGEGAAGKQGPSATDPGNGWKAPYLEEVPHFPIASDNIANPHRMKPHVGLSLHTDGLEPETSKKELDEIPDTAFTDWGSVDGPTTGKRAHKEEEKKDEAKADPENDDDANGEPPKKKLKTHEEKEDASTRPPYVAAFMPSFPKSLQAGRSIVDIPTTSATTQATEDLPGVRSSLVDLGQSSHYWGSGWDAKVPVGKSQDKGNPVVVIPLGRASNSRVSRILEGSMDAYS